MLFLKNSYTRILTGLAVLACISITNQSSQETAAQPVQSCEWGLHFEQDNTLPIPNMSDDILNPLGAYFHGNTDEKVIYITFDAGYENGHTEKILDALKKHNAPAAFFLVGPYIKDNPLLVDRMVKEGHTVGNHSYDHPDMTGKTKEEFLYQLNKTAEIFKTATGTDMPKFYRPPEGKFTTENLKWAQEAGYTTVLWSSAYVDWNNDSQPSHSYAFEKIARRTFDGAVFLLHSTSQTNAEILDEQLAKWTQAGYRFGDITELANQERDKTNNDSTNIQ